MSGDGVHVLQPGRGRAHLVNGGGQCVLAVGGPGRQGPFVLGHQLAQLAVEHPRVAAGGHRGIGLAAERVGDLLGPVPLVGQGPAVVDHHPGRVPGVGGPAGAGLAGVAPVGVQRRAAQQVAGLPGAALGPVDGPGPGVGQVGGAVLTGAGHERRREQYLGSFVAVEANGQPIGACPR